MQKPETEAQLHAHIEGTNAREADVTAFVAELLEWCKAIPVEPSFQIATFITSPNPNLQDDIIEHLGVDRVVGLEKKTEYAEPIEKVLETIIKDRFYSENLKDFQDESHKLELYKKILTVALAKGEYQFIQPLRKLWEIEQKSTREGEAQPKNSQLTLRLYENNFTLVHDLLAEVFMRNNGRYSHLPEKQLIHKPTGFPIGYKITGIDYGTGVATVRFYFSRHEEVTGTTTGGNLPNGNYMIGTVREGGPSNSYEGGKFIEWRSVTIPLFDAEYAIAPEAMPKKYGGITVQAELLRKNSSEYVISLRQTDGGLVNVQWDGTLKRWRSMGGGLFADRVEGPVEFTDEQKAMLAYQEIAVQSKTAPEDEAHEETGKSQLDLYIDRQREQDEKFRDLHHYLQRLRTIPRQTVEEYKQQVTEALANPTDEQYLTVLELVYREPVLALELETEHWARISALLVDLNKYKPFARNSHEDTLRKTVQELKFIGENVKDNETLKKFPVGDQSFIVRNIRKTISRFLDEHKSPNKLQILIEKKAEIMAIARKYITMYEYASGRILELMDDPTDSVTFTRVMNQLFILVQAGQEPEGGEAMEYKILELLTA